MVEKGIKGEIFLSVQRYAIPNNKCMRKYNQVKDSSHLEYLILKNALYGWKMSQK